MPNPNEATGLKQLFQGMVPEGTTIVNGTVVSTSPLSIRIENDEKLVVSGSVLLVPRNLTDWQTKVDISLAGGKINSVTIQWQGRHGHTSDGIAYPGSDLEVGAIHKDGDHQHKLSTFIIEGALMTVYNALQVDETVYLLKFNNGKNYLVLDRAYL